MLLIKELLDEGYTLNAVTKKLESWMQMIESILMKFNSDKKKKLVNFF